MIHLLLHLASVLAASQPQYAPQNQQANQPQLPNPASVNVNQAVAPDASAAAYQAYIQQQLQGVQPRQRTPKQDQTMAAYQYALCPTAPQPAGPLQANQTVSMRFAVAWSPESAIANACQASGAASACLTDGYDAMEMGNLLLSQQLPFAFIPPSAYSSASSPHSSVLLNTGVIVESIPVGYLCGDLPVPVLCSIASQQTNSSSTSSSSSSSQQQYMRNRCPNSLMSSVSSSNSAAASNSASVISATSRAVSNVTAPLCMNPFANATDASTVFAGLIVAPFVCPTQLCGLDGFLVTQPQTFEQIVCPAGYQLAMLSNDNLQTAGQAVSQCTADSVAWVGGWNGDRYNQSTPNVSTTNATVQSNAFLVLSNGSNNSTASNNPTIVPYDYQQGPAIAALCQRVLNDTSSAASPLDSSVTCHDDSLLPGLFVLPQRVNYPDAQAACACYGGQLASIRPDDSQTLALLHQLVFACPASQVSQAMGQSANQSLPEARSLIPQQQAVLNSQPQGSAVPRSQPQISSPRSANQVTAQPAGQQPLQAQASTPLGGGRQMTIQGRTQSNQSSQSRNQSNQSTDIRARSSNFAENLDEYVEYADYAEQSQGAPLLWVQTMGQDECCAGLLPLEQQAQNGSYFGAYGLLFESCAQAAYPLCMLPAPNSNQTSSTVIANQNTCPCPTSLVETATTSLATMAQTQVVPLTATSALTQTQVLSLTETAALTQVQSFVSPVVSVTQQLQA